MSVTGLHTFHTYFELLLSSSPARSLFRRMRSLEDGEEKRALQDGLRKAVVAGAVDVNIMTKCDRTNHDGAGEPLPPEYADARAALRGFALSELSASVVFSAGLNPRLYTYCEAFEDFFPDEHGHLRKTITLKVSDYNFRKSSSEEQRKERIAKGRPGSPCYKKFLAFNTEFTSEPICTASRQYQRLKLAELRGRELSPEAFRHESDLITRKECLCEGLGAGPGAEPGLLLESVLAPRHDRSHLWAGERSQ